MARRVNQKLVAKYFGPFIVVAKVGAVALRLQLPDTSRIHPVFHISQLKKYVGSNPSPGTLPLMDDQGLIAAYTIAVLDRKSRKKGNGAVVYVLIQWSNAPKELGSSTLMSRRNFLISTLKLEDKLAKGDGNVTAEILGMCEAREWRGN